MKHIRKISTVLAAVLIISSCASLKSEKLRVMPYPVVMGAQENSPFPENGEFYGKETLPLLYVTNRIPDGDCSTSPYYGIRLSEALRAGVADVGVVGRDRTWKDLMIYREESDPTERAMLRLDAVEDFGILESSATIFSALGKGETIDSTAEDRFLEEIRKRMEAGGSREVTIFVHGYNVNFANPVLMSAELWHYMGYKGAFICFAWPATPKGTAYQQDLNKSLLSTRSLRLLLDILEKQEDIEGINLIGYSMGSGLVMQSLYEKGLRGDALSGESKIADVLLTNSDMDQELFGTYLLEGAAELAGNITVYTSSQDLVLKGAQVIHSEYRLGQTAGKKKLSPEALAYYYSLNNVNFVDVSRADMIGSMGGHFYQTESPWVSSDIILNLTTTLGPAERGLVPHENLPLWQFPRDYIELSRNLLKKTEADQG